MKIVSKHKITALLFLAVFTLGTITDAYAASKYIPIDTLSAYTNEASIDLNGDKIKDKIIFSVNLEEENYTLSINGTVVKGDGIGLEGNFRIIDINTKDKYKEIAVQELGYSDDYAMAFYTYNGKSIISTGKLHGYGTSINQSGKVMTNARGYILCTWFYKDYYNLSNKHKLQHIPMKTYPMNLKVTVLKPLSLQTSPTNTKTKVKLKVGEKVTILSTDNKSWCKVKNSKGVTGYFVVEDYGKIKGTDSFAYEVFDGLSFAD